VRELSHNLTCPRVCQSTKPMLFWGAVRPIASGMTCDGRSGGKPNEMDNVDR